MKNWRTSSAYRLWRRRVKKRDGYCCVVCESTHKLHAHHLRHATYFINDRFNVDNGVCICAECHMNFHCNFMRSYRHKCDAKDWINFKVLVGYITRITINNEQTRHKEKSGW